MRIDVIAAALIGLIATRTTPSGVAPQWQFAFTLVFSSETLAVGLFRLTALAAFPLARWLLVQALVGDCHG
jgi:hypothetical protein